MPAACCCLREMLSYYRSLLKNWKSFLHSIGFAVSEPFLASRIEPACLFGCMCYVIPASIGGQEVGKKWGLKWVRKSSCFSKAGKIQIFTVFIGFNNKKAETKYLFWPVKNCTSLKRTKWNYNFGLWSNFQDFFTNDRNSNWWQ